MKSREAFFLSLLVVLILVVLQSTLFYYVHPGMVVPDLALTVTAFCGARRGMQTGELLGFCNGLAEDFLTASFPGFNALIKTVTGFLAGAIKNKMLFDPVLFPSLFILSITVLKYCLTAVIAYLFFPKGYFPSIFNTTFLLEIVLNSFFAPIVYFLLKKTRLIPNDIWENGR